MEEKEEFTQRRLTLWEKFLILNGFKQGSCIAPALYKIYQFEVMKAWRAKRTEKR